MVPLAYMAARAFGYVLNVNSMLVLFFILRQTLTKLRSFGFSIILPLDHHVELHKLVGRFIFFHAWAHSIAHFINLPNFLNGNVKYFLCDNGGVVTFSCPKPEDRDSTTQCFEMVDDLCVPCCPREKENILDFVDIEPPELSALEWIFTPKPRILGRPGSQNTQNI